MKTKLLPAVVSILLLTSLFFPAVNAAPSGIEEPELGGALALLPAAVAAPEVCEIIISGLAVVISGAAAVEIGKTLGITWDGVAENWNNFLSNVQNELNNPIRAKKWISITSEGGKSVMEAVYKCWNAAGSSGGKKDDKWYFEARRNHGEIEINLERMNEEQAVKEMGRGKDIMTLNKELAQKLVGRYEGIDPAEVKFEKPHQTRDGYFDHANYNAHGMRLHCWIWRNV